MDDDWDLHAVVRGCAATTRADGNDSFPSVLPGHLNGVQHSFDFPELEEKKSTFQGLQQICKHSSIDTNTPPPSAVTAAVSVPLVPMQTTALNTQPTRSRRSPVVKMVREMTQEEVSGDSWAWRKYGQKPIKGSPYPRNYYRCSTSKVCGARKQVERSPNDPALFMVSYTGDHTHPRPAYRSSISGSIRNKVVPPQAAATAKIKSNNGIIDLSPPASGLSFSPSTPLLEGEAAVQNDDVEVLEEEEVLAQ